MSSYSVEAKSAFESGTTMTVVLMALLQRSFGDDFYFWDPTTIYLEIRDEFGAEPATPVMDRISAGQVVISGDQFFQDISAFLNICNTLASGQPSFSLFDPVEPEEAAWALTEVSLMRDLHPFASTIKRYMQIKLEEDGYLSDDYPDVFKYMFEKQMPRSRTFKTMLERTLHDDQTDNVEAFVQDHLADVVYQFDKIPGMADSLTELLRAKDLEDLGKLENV